MSTQINLQPRVHNMRHQHARTLCDTVCVGHATGHWMASMTRVQIAALTQNGAIINQSY